MRTVEYEGIAGVGGTLDFWTKDLKMNTFGRLEEKIKSLFPPASLEEVEIVDG